MGLAREVAMRVVVMILAALARHCLEAPLLRLVGSRLMKLKMR